MNYICFSIDRWYLIFSSQELIEIIKSQNRIWLIQSYHLKLFILFCKVLYVYIFRSSAFLYLVSCHRLNHVTFNFSDHISVVCGLIWTFFTVLPPRSWYGSLVSDALEEWKSWASVVLLTIGTANIKLATHMSVSVLFFLDPAQTYH